MIRSPLREATLNRSLVFLWALAVFIPSPLGAADAVSLAVDDAVIARGVENLTPVGPSESFDSDVGKVYFFTRVVGASESTAVKHLWFFGDRLVMEITLPVNSANWRTYSSKTILSSAVGPWRADITTEDGTLLKSIPFTIK